MSSFLISDPFLEFSSASLEFWHVLRYWNIDYLNKLLKQII